MMFCDLAIDGVAVWSMVTCLNGVSIKPASYFGFSGDLVFMDTAGSSNPEYGGLGSRYLLLYIPESGDNSVVPLQALPSQSLDIILASQNCTLRLYDRTIE